MRKETVRRKRTFTEKDLKELFKARGKSRKELLEEYRAKERENGELEELASLSIKQDDYFISKYNFAVSKSGNEMIVIELVSPVSTLTFKKYQLISDEFLEKFLRISKSGWTLDDFKTRDDFDQLLGRRTKITDFTLFHGTLNAQYFEFLPDVIEDDESVPVDFDALEKSLDIWDL